ncbi:MAG: glycosyltransferase [Clostridiales bacterium]|nr:glycosyltransferase [Clostridiales bacterium]
MNVLLLSVKAGYGHHSTAKAVINEFEEHGHRCEMLDIFDYINHHLGNTIQDGYLLSTKLIPRAYGLVYDKMNREDRPYSKRSVTSLLSNIVTKKLRGFVEGFAPDVIIATHSYAGVVATLLNKSVTSCPTIGIVTDFTVHPFWESTILDYYVIPNRQLTYQMNKKGIPTNKLLPIGIPVRKQFSQKTDKQLARRMLGIENKKTILIMMGSMGYGDITDNIAEMDAFESDFQMLVVCGSNKKLKAQVDEHDWKKTVYCYGFVDNVDVMMDASDIIITKPGGLTTSETFAKGLPMITMNPLPGQEDKNLVFLVNNGAAVAVNSEFTIVEALYQLLTENWRVEHMKESIAHIGKPNATRDLYNFVENLCQNKENAGELTV